MHRGVLVTGGSGVVGAAVLSRLADAPVPASELFALSHRQPIGVGRSLTGDISKERLGLGAAEYRELTGRVGTVLHCAGSTDFDMGHEVHQALNVRGTENAVRFAADAGARLVYASTAFVARLDLARAAGTGGSTVLSSEPYLVSKLAAEEVVRNSGLPAAIARISVITGDATTGEIARFQGLHSTTAAVLRNLLPVLPFAPDATVDIIPQDVVAEALLAVVDRPGEYWLTSGPAAPTVTRVVALMVAGGTRAGLRVSTPRLVRLSTVDKLVRPTFIDPLPVQARRKFDNLMALAALFDGASAFPTSVPDLGLDIGDLERAFLASVDHLARIKGYQREGAIR